MPDKKDYFEELNHLTRDQLMMADMDDDTLANTAFLQYDRKPTVLEMLNGKLTPLVIMTAVKERLRWLSRQLTKEKLEHEKTKQELKELKDKLNPA